MSLRSTSTCKARAARTIGSPGWSGLEPTHSCPTAGREEGRFSPHKDHLALTVLIPLTSPTRDFSGGGTGFWSADRVVNDAAMAELMDENKGSSVPDGEPDVVLKPPLGSALLFGGDLTHAGMPVETGLRSVVVASFSTRTPASPPDRIHGLQRAPPSSWSESFSAG